MTADREAQFATLAGERVKDGRERGREVHCTMGNSWEWCFSGKWDSPVWDTILT